MSISGTHSAKIPACAGIFLMVWWALFATLFFYPVGGLLALCEQTARRHRAWVAIAAHVAGMAFELDVVTVALDGYL